MADVPTEPAWFTAKVDQRVAMVTEATKRLTNEQLSRALLVTQLAEEIGNATPLELERWERSCDACNAYCPHPTPFYTGTIARFIRGVYPLVISFGVCEQHRF